MKRLFFVLVTFIASPLYAQQGVGVIHVTVQNPSQLPNRSVVVTGPNGFRKSLTGKETLTRLEDGVYTFTGDIVIQREAGISKAYRLSFRQVTVKRDTHNISIVYQLMPGSDKIWLGNQNAPINQNLNIIAYGDEKLSTSATLTPDVRLTSRVTSIRCLAFDEDGNLWTADADKIKMYTWHQLGGSNATAQVTLTHEAHALAFDRDGNLWFSDGKAASKIMRIPKKVLYQSGGNKADIVLEGPAFNGSQSIAFDAAGNLWVANKSKHNVVKIPAEMLTNSASGIDNLITITCMSPPPVIGTLNAPIGMAFDRGGNLWVGYFGPNVIAMIPSSQLSQSGKITPDIQITLSVSVLLNQLAFDEDGSLWMALGEGKFGKLGPQQLTSGGKKTPDVVISSAELRYGSGVALFPHPKGFPIGICVKNP
jgi:streptogramin lyase